MPTSRRGGRSSAAAAADAVAWRLGLALLLLMPRGVVDASLDMTTFDCDNVPYPFGVRGKSQTGFEVTCGANMETMLPIGEQAYRIDSVSVTDSYVVVFAGAVTQVCYDRRSGRPTPATGTGPTSLEGTPFTFSKRNSLVNMGCNRTLIANFSNLGDPSTRPSAGCTTLCKGGDTTIHGSSCIGEACCEIQIPDQVSSTQAFTLSFDRTTPGNATGEEYGTCSAAFFVKKDEQALMFQGKRPLNKALLPPGERRMILDWAIGSTTCDLAQSLTFQPLCNGICVDAPSRPGYLCRCRQGYQGNPYTSRCDEDINECQDYNSNNCTYLDHCNNTVGGYTCSCPGNDIGDGYRTGTGCKANASTALLTPGISVCSDCRQHFPLDTALGVGLALMVTVTTAVSCYCWAMKKRELVRKRAELFRKNGGLLLQQRFSTITSQGEDRSAKIFSAEELKAATDNYSDSRILGRGGYGTVYKGILAEQTMIAIKKSKVFDENQVEQFVNEITILSKIDHPNVVKLLGCCLETPVPLLVYEFIPNGTLFQHIHNINPSRPLTWEDCLRMSSEIAEALAHLHSTSSIPIIHRDIKSSNILLDENFVAKIADFGASRSVPFDQTHITTLIQGTIGYLDPEYFQSGQLTEKSDVYSFGVVLAELLTRQKPISTARPEESCNLAMHLVVLFNDGRLLQEIEPYILAEAGEEQFYAVAELSVRCLNVKGEERPSMKEVASILDGLRRSLTMEQTVRRKDESVQKNSEQEVHLPRETRPISSLQSSEVSTQCSMDAEMLSSSYMPR